MESEVTIGIVTLITVLILLWVRSIDRKSETTDKKMDEIESYLVKIQDLKKNMNISKALMRNLLKLSGLKLKF